MKKPLLLLAIFLTVIVFVYGVIQVVNPTTEMVEISGTIVQIDPSCESDGVCRLKIDDQWIITDLGGDPTLAMSKKRGPKGKVLLPDGLAYSNVIGKEASARLGTDSSGNLTLYGDSEYFVQIFE